MQRDGEGPSDPKRRRGWQELALPRVVGDGRGGASQLEFGPLPLMDGVPPSWLRLLNLLPHQLLDLELTDGERPCYQLDSRVDGVGRTTSAGELLLSMARMQGWNALVVDVRGLPGVCAATRVRCRVARLPLDAGRLCRLEASFR